MLTIKRKLSIFVRFFCSQKQKQKLELEHEREEIGRPSKHVTVKQVRRRQFRAFSDIAPPNARGRRAQDRTNKRKERWAKRKTDK
jgi:hypothetical protein